MDKSKKHPPIDEDLEERINLAYAAEATKAMQSVDNLGNTMDDYDRWGTPRGVQKTTSKLTPEQKKLAAQINAERAQKQRKEIDYLAQHNSDKDFIDMFSRIEEELFRENGDAEALEILAEEKRQKSEDTE